MAHLFTSPVVSITANPQTVTLAQSVPAGSLILVLVSQFYGANPPRAIASVADSVNAGNYALSGAETTDANIPIAAFHKVAGGTGTPTVSVSFTGGIPNGSVTVIVYDGQHTTPGPTANAATSTATSSPGVVDTGATSALRVSMYGTGSDYYTLNDTGSGTARGFQSINGSGPNSVYIADRVVAGSVAHSVSFSSARAAAALTVSFTGSGGGAPSPTISGVSSMSPRKGSSLTITGSNFGATRGTGSVTIGGVVQTVTSWSDSSITVTVSEGENPYGVGLQIVVTANGALVSSPYSLTELLPPTGRSYVNVGTPSTTSTARITAAPDAASGDQLEHDSALTVNPDLTFSVSAPGSYAVRLWTSGDGWGAEALQVVSDPVTPPSTSTIAAILAAF